MEIDGEKIGSKKKFLGLASQQDFNGEWHEYLSLSLSLSLKHSLAPADQKIFPTNHLKIFLNNNYDIEEDSVCLNLTKVMEVFSKYCDMLLLYIFYYTSLSTNGLFYQSQMAELVVSNPEILGSSPA